MLMIEYVTSGHITDRKKFQYERKRAEDISLLVTQFPNAARKNDQLWISQYSHFLPLRVRLRSGIISGTHLCIHQGNERPITPVLKKDEEEV